MAKKAEKTVDVEKATVTINFLENNHTVSLGLAEVPDPIKTQLALHGTSQKMGDSYAGAETVDDAIAACERVVADLKAGNWTAARAAGGPRLTKLAEALSRVSQRDDSLPNLTVEEAVAIVSEADDDVKKELRSNPAIKAEMARIDLERAEAASANPEAKTLSALLS